MACVARSPGSADFGVPTREESVVLLDEDSHLECLEKPLKKNAYRLKAYSDLADLLTAGIPESPSCLLLGDRFPDGMTGLAALAELQRRNWNVPTVILARDCTVQKVVDAMKAGADGFLAKPCDPAELLAAVDHALSRARNTHVEEHSRLEAKSRIASLNSREMEIVRMILGGLLNKEIADEMNLALITVKVCRARIMKKLGAGNPAEMARIAGLGGVRIDGSGSRSRIAQYH